MRLNNLRADDCCDAPDLAAVQQNIAYKRELLAGDIVEIRSAPVEIRDKSIRLQHETRNVDDY